MSTTRLARFAIFTNKRIPPIVTATEVLKAEVSKIEEESTEKFEGKKAVIELKDDQKLMHKEINENLKPSYFGYLSGVVSAFWSPAHKMTSAEQEVHKLPLNKDKPKIIVKRLSRMEVIARTKSLVKQLLGAETLESRFYRMKELSKHLMEFPASRFVLVQDNPEVISFLLKQLETTVDDNFKGETRVCLALCGYTNPPKAKGIRLLSIDGGGTRGLMALEVLAELEKNLGGRLADHFDLIAGVSTGAIISVLLGAHRMKVSQAKEIYMELSRQLFTQSRLSGVSGLLLSHSYYNTKKWVEIIKNVIGDGHSMMDTARNANSVKIAIVSCIVNALQLQPYVFRNYQHGAGRDSHFRGGTKHQLWEAIQASAAAPGYFEEVLLGTMLHQDGGVLANNPTAIALHESRLLWPFEPIQCVVSVGNGRTVTELELTSASTNTGIQDKITKIVDSATDTELVHLSMTDLLNPHVYFRLNPYMTFPYTLDEIDADKLEQMNKDARSYVRRNKLKIRSAALQLSRPTSICRWASRKFWRLRDLHGKYKPS